MAVWLHQFSEASLSTWVYSTTCHRYNWIVSAAAAPPINNLLIILYGESTIRTDEGPAGTGTLNTELAYKAHFCVTRERVHVLTNWTQLDGFGYTRESSAKSIHSKETISRRGLWLWYVPNVLFTLNPMNGNKSEARMYTAACIQNNVFNCSMCIEGKST